MGCLPDLLPGHRDVNDDDARSRFGALWGAAPPAAAGRNVMEIIRGIEEGSVRALVLMGADLLACLPEAGRVEKALRKLELLVVHDLMMTGTAEIAGLVLPSMSNAERDGTITSTERMVRLVRKAIEPGAHMREGWRFFADLSRMMGHETGYDSPEKVFGEIVHAVPAYGGMNYSLIEGEGGLRWKYGGGNGHRPVRKGTVSGKAGEREAGDIYMPGARKGPGPSFHAVDVRLPDRGGMPFTLVLRGILKEYHHYTGDLDYFVASDAIMNPLDAGGIGIGDGDRARITTPNGSIIARVMLDPGVRRGVITLSFQRAGGNAGDLVAWNLDPDSGIPAYKSCGARIEKAGDE